MTGGEILTNLSNTSPFLFPQMETRGGIIKWGIILIFVIVLIIWAFVTHKD